MRLQLTIILVLISAFCFGQSWEPFGTGFQRKIIGQDTLYRVIGGSKGYWDISSALAAAGGAIPGGAITSIPTIGFNPGEELTASDWINSVFYQSQAPTASLSGGITQELSAPGITNYNLNWNVNRLAATAEINIINVAGVSVSFTQPNAPGTVSGVREVTLTHNSNQTFTVTATTTDGKSVSASTSFTYLPQSYRGFIADVSSIETGASDAAILGLAYGFTSNKSLSYTTGAVSDKYLIYAYPSLFGLLSSISINGFPSLASFSYINKPFTNASGYTQNYYIYFTKNKQTTSGYPVIAN